MLNSLTLNARLFLRGAYLSYIALFAWLRPTTYLASKVIGPIMQILFFTFLGTYATGADTADFYIIGNSVQIVALSGVFGVSMSIGGDRWNGTLPYLFGTPANRLAMFVGRGVVHVLDGLAGVLIAFTFGVVILGLDLGQANLPVLVLAILVTSFSTSGMGLMLGALSLITVNVMFVNNLVYFMLLLFSGANVRLASLPAWIQTLSNFIPLTRGLAAARALIEGAVLADVSGLLLEEFLIGVAYVAVGYVLFRWFEGQAKRRGTLEMM